MLDLLNMLLTRGQSFVDLLLCILLVVLTLRLALCRKTAWTVTAMVGAGLHALSLLFWVGTDFASDLAYEADIYWLEDLLGSFGILWDLMDYIGYPSLIVLLIGIGGMLWKMLPSGPETGTPQTGRAPGAD